LCVLRELFVASTQILFKASNIVSGKLFLLLERGDKVVAFLKGVFKLIDGFSLLVESVLKLRSQCEK